MRPLVFLFCLVSFAAQAQSVQQSGNVTPGHVTSWITNGVIGDGGPLGGGATLNGMFNAFDFLCANSLSNTPLIISCGLSATGTNTWNGFQNLSGGATAPTRSTGDNTTNVATTAFVNSLLSTSNTWSALQTFNGGIHALNLQLLNAAPQSTVDLQSVVPVNGFYASGSGAIFQNCPLIGCLVGDHQQSALYLKATATRDKSIAEYMATFDCNLNSGSTGVGTFSDAKVCLFNSATTGSSAGNATWGMANDLVVGAGDTGLFKVSAEFDITNHGTDCAVGVKNCYSVYISGDVDKQITAMLALALPVGTVLPAAHYGFLINGQHIADTADIEESGGAPTAICIGCLIAQTHSVAVLQDFSTSPVGLWLRGTYATDAIVSPGFSVNGSGQVGATSASAVGAGFLAYAMSSTANFGIFFSSGNPSVSAAAGSINLDASGKLWVRTDASTWTQVTVP